MTNETIINRAGADRKHQAFEMRIMGHDYLDIADALKVSEGQASKWVRDELERRAAFREQNPRHVIELELATLDALQDALSGRVAGEREAIKLTLVIMERRGMLLGLLA